MTRSMGTEARERSVEWVLFPERRPQPKGPTPRLFTAGTTVQ